jgi:ATP-dependent DNA helicase RecG
MKAKFRLVFEELFFIQFVLLLKPRSETQNKRPSVYESGQNFDFYQNHLPFELTGAQKRVIKEIRTDMGTNAQMNRLLQGDVGSGKTIVALYEHATSAR